MCVVSPDASHQWWLFTYCDSQTCLMIKTIWDAWEKCSSAPAWTFWRVCVRVTQSCPTLCDPMDCKLPGSSVHGILQARGLKWVAFSFFRGSSQPRDWTQAPTLQADSLPSEPQGKHVNSGSVSLNGLRFVDLKKKKKEWFLWLDNNLLKKKKLN